MKYFRRYLSLLSVFVLLLAVFSVNIANAELISVPNPSIVTEIFVDDNVLNKTFFFTPNDGNIEKSEFSSGSITYSPNVPNDITHTFRCTFYDSNNNTIVVIPKGNTVTLTLERVAYSIYHLVAPNQFDYTVRCTNARFLIYYDDGSFQYVDDVEQTLDITSKYRSTFSGTFTPKKNVVAFELIVYNQIPSGTYKIFLGETDGTHEGYYVTVDQHTKTESILDMIVGRISNVWSSIVDGFSNMSTSLIELPQKIWNFISNGFTNTVNALSGLPQKIWDFISTGFTNTVNALSGLPQKIWDFISTGFTNTVKAVQELPQTIWNYISDGLKTLFVPSEEFVLGFKEDMDALLAEKFGAVYEVIHILGDSWDRIKLNDSTNSIYLPKTTIPLPQDNSFSFGGYDVLIVPNGFEFFADIVKGFCGVLATLVFLSGLRKKYEEIMGVEK